MIFGDIAGLLDTKGPTIELLHIFMNKLIFNQACFVRFIVPFTYAQLFNSRGQEAVEQLKVIQNMVNANLNEIGDSIIPIITKVDPKDANFDIDEIRYNLHQ